jgi:hypothetical protein
VLLLPLIFLENFGEGKIIAAGFLGAELSA